MADLHAGQFREFFQALHGKPPFPWQEALAEQVCASEWPEVINLPTGSGKTACIDIALFALAVRGKEAPRRIFFVVDRRIVVNEAYLRMRKVRCALKRAESGVLHTVAEKFRQLARGNEPPGEKDVDGEPLFVSEMRGGAFRDESWIRNPLQPTVVASTVDQVGSRLLFRGYGVSQNSWPLHAGMIGNDALIFLDEAHCSRAFAQTLKRVEKYRGPDWASEGIQTPFRFVEMTATPSQTPINGFFELTARDRSVDVLKKRLQAAKPTRLIEIKGRKDDTAKLVDALVEQAIELAKTAEGKRVVIFANRVKTAKCVYEHLQKEMKGTGAQVELLIGRMRAIDRDHLYKSRLERLKSGEERKAEDPLTFVVSTQCLEVGADLDFDVLVSECASIDALQQRFGRLNRLGDFERAQGAIVIGSWQINPKQPDAVYEEALPKTWLWLKSIADQNDSLKMGIESPAGEPPTVSEKLNELDARELRLIGEDAPILLPTHVDMLAQTNPTPAPDPLVELFLHGPKRSVPDVQVVWRGDLESAQTAEDGIEIMKLCPPSSLEAMPVSISAFRKWFAGEKDINSNESDLETGTEEDGSSWQRREKPYVLAWDGEDSKLIVRSSDIRPGQTLILKTSTEVWNDLGHIPEGSLIDVGDRAALVSRKSVSLRLHPGIMEKWPVTPALETLCDHAKKQDADRDEIERCLEAYRDELAATEKQWPYQFLEKLKDMRRIELDEYPRLKEGYVLRARMTLASSRQESKQVFLEDHLAHVEESVVVMSFGLDSDLQGALRNSAQFHDYGKVDVRYQAWLRGGDPRAARCSAKPLAKSGNDILKKQEMVGLPKGFRHELLSLMFAEKSPQINGDIRDLVLHLVATHHGRCRPFAPVVRDENAECVSFKEASIYKEERIGKAPHRLDSGITDRFWRLIARYGWWGLAYLEALLRLADWQASGQESAEVSE